MEYTTIQMELNTKGTGKMIFRISLVKKFGRMEVNIQDFMKKGKNKG